VVYRSGEGGGARIVDHFGDAPDRVRGGCGPRLPTEPCVRVRTRLLT
jgi:hypothetical protein